MQIRLPTTRIRWISKTNPQLFESALQSGNFWIRYESRIAWMLNLDIFISGDVTKSSPVLYPEYCIKDGNFLPRFSLTRFYDACSVANRVNPAYVSDTCGRANSIWIPIRMDAEIFESGKKKLLIQKISGYVWTGRKSSTLGIWWAICRESPHFRKLINPLSFYRRSLSVTRYN